MTDHADLIARLRALARAVLDDLSVADEAADAVARPATEALATVRKYLRNEPLWFAIVDPSKPATTDNTLGAMIDAALGAGETARSPDPAGGAPSTEMDAALFGVGFKKVTLTEDEIKRVRVAPRDVYLSTADREAAIRAEATAAERERCARIASRYGHGATILAAIRGGGQ